MILAARVESKNEFQLESYDRQAFLVACVTVERDLTYDKAYVCKLQTYLRKCFFLALIDNCERCTADDNGPQPHCLKNNSIVYINGFQGAIFRLLVIFYKTLSKDVACIVIDLARLCHKLLISQCSFSDVFCNCCKQHNSSLAFMRNV